jgi:hypothetical protein
MVVTVEEGLELTHRRLEDRRLNERYDLGGLRDNVGSDLGDGVYHE